MEIIPVIDLMRGKVVHATGGVRADYPFLTSVLTQSHEPLSVIRDLCEHAPFSTFYIADLDAIEGGDKNYDFYQTLSQQFPDIEFMLDAGIKNKQDWLRFLDYPNIIPIIGSETLLELNWLNDESVKERGILSLDFKAKHFLGDKHLLDNEKLWTRRIIVMNLDCIASAAGTDLSLLTQIQSQTQSDIIAAGGIRGKYDLRSLEQQGIKQVLVASALHDGRLAING